MMKNCKNKIQFYLKKITEKDYIKSIRYATTLANFTFMFTLILTLFSMVVNSQNTVTYNDLYYISLLPFILSILFELLFLISDLIFSSKNWIFTLSTYIPFPLTYIVLYKISLHLLNYLFSDIFAKNIIFKVLVLWYGITLCAQLLQRILREINLHIIRKDGI